jgi:anaerobic selenocysteine-containing dehydrogenase
LLTEDYYVFNKLVKGLLGTNNLDTNSRLCMSSAVAGYKATLGADAPPACYEDIDLAGCMFITGSNMAWAHPILFQAWKRPGRATRSSGSSWPTRAVPRPQSWPISICRCSRAAM